MRAFAVALSLCCTACITSERDFVARDAASQIVTVGAGRALVSDTGGDYWRLWYIIDPATRTCWFKVGDSVGELDCCRLRRVPVAVKHVGWLRSEDCEYLGRGGMQPATSLPPATEPRTSVVPVVPPPALQTPSSSAPPTPATPINSTSP